MAYQSTTEICEENGEDDIYKSTFKFYKQAHNLESVIDFNDCNYIPPNVVHLEAPKSNLILPDCSTRDHFKPYNEWKIYTLNDAVPGLIVIPEILREDFRLDWFSYFRDHLPMRDDLNLKANVILEKKKKLDNLRWITFGLHHNWDTKVYNFDQSSVVIPERIAGKCFTIMINIQCT